MVMLDTSDDLIPVHVQEVQTTDGNLDAQEPDVEAWEVAYNRMVGEAGSMLESLHATIVKLASLEILIRKDPADLRLIGVLQYLRTPLEELDDQAAEYAFALNVWANMFADYEGETPL